jgi:hypothetical protein
MKEIKKQLYLICSIFIVSKFLLFSINIASASIVPSNSWGLGSDLSQMILNLTNYLLFLAGALAVLALIWGGLNYITASGDTKKIELAKMIIYYTLIGLFIAGLAYALVKVIVTIL